LPDSKPEQSDSSRSKDFDLDNLLEQVGQLTKRAEMLITQSGVKEKAEVRSAEKIVKEAAEDQPGGEPFASAENDDEFDEAGDIRQLDDFAHQQAYTVESELRAEDEKPSVSSEEVSSEDEPKGEIAVDEQTELMAEDEINRVLSKLNPQSTAVEFSAVSEVEKTVSPAIPAEIYPSVCQTLLVVLFAINRPFLWLPQSARNVLGYFGLATLLFALGLWLLLAIVYG
jgi:hypothetical protein